MTTLDAPTPRSPLTREQVTAALDRRGLSGQVHVLPVCESTNATAAELVAGSWATGAVGTVDQPWLLVTAEEQTRGRGRLDRRWSAPAGSGLLFTLALAVPTGTPPSVTGWLPLLAGMAVVATSREVGVAATLKWPNDVVIGEEPRKLAGILVERVGDWALVGVGLNVDLTSGEAPVPAATSLLVEGATADLDRSTLLAAVVARIVSRWRHLLQSGSAHRSGLRDEYLENCSTLGREIQVKRLGADDLRGKASDIDADGHLVVVGAQTGSKVRVTVGDVVHLRSAG